MRVIEEHDIETGWITAVIRGRWVHAKVYDEPSDYGVNGGRVSKLSIGKSEKRCSESAFHPQMCYHYDRGLDFDDLNDNELLCGILKELEELPQLFEYDENGVCLNET